MKYLKVCIILVISHLCFSQDILDDIELLKSLDGSYEVVYESYSNSIDRPVYKEKVRIIKSENKYYTEFRGNKMVVNDSTLLFIDNREKEILVNRHVDPVVHMKDFKVNEVPVNLLDLYTISSENKSKDIHAYTFVPKEESIVKKLYVEIDIKKKMLNRMDYEYTKEGEKLLNQTEGGTRLVSYSRNPKIDESLFRLNTYYRNEGEELRGVSDFSQYTIIDIQE